MKNEEYALYVLVGGLVLGAIVVVARVVPGLLDFVFLAGMVFLVAQHEGFRVVSVDNGVTRVHFAGIAFLLGLSYLLGWLSRITESAFALVIQASGWVVPTT